SPSGGSVARGGSPSGGSPSGGSAGAAACNDLALLPATPTCSPVGVMPAPSGGLIPDGTYALVAFNSTDCSLTIEETIDITRTSDNTYSLEIVVSVAAAGINEVTA